MLPVLRGRVRGAVSGHFTWFASTTIALATFFGYGGHLSNAFLGDDVGQIVENPLVHSLGNVVTFFRGSSFSTGAVGSSLQGSYYRPIQTLVYSAAYAVAGPRPFAFHLLQLAVHIANGILLYRVLRRWFRRTWSLALALLFGLHPVNSQAVYAIASLQDVLFFFFGILALWLLINRRSSLGVALASMSLLLSLLSKETGIAFVLLAGAYLYWFDRDRLARFGLGAVTVIGAYLALRLGAVGLAPDPNNAPIDKVSLGGRLLNMPSLFAFDLMKMVWPFGLASSYYWVHSTFSFSDTILPLALDLGVLALYVYGGMQVRRGGESCRFHSYLFFGFWWMTGIALHLQIIPLDMTASETWLYFPMVGFFGMIAVTLATVKWASIPSVKLVLLAGVVSVAMLFGSLTATRGGDWRDQFTLASHDIQVQPGNYQFEWAVAEKLDTQGDFQAALQYAQESVAHFPHPNGYAALGLTYYKLGDYAAAANAYLRALSYVKTLESYEGLARAFALLGGTQARVDFVHDALAAYPQSATLWEYLAFLEYERGHNAEAVSAISRAYSLSHSAEITQAYQIIVSGQPLHLRSG